MRPGLIQQGFGWMNKRLILNIIGDVILIEAAMMLLPLLVGGDLSGMVRDIFPNDGCCLRYFGRLSVQGAVKAQEYVSQGRLCCRGALLDLHQPAGRAALHVVR